MHFTFIGIPAPATALVYCDVGKRVELESLKAFVSRTRLSRVDVAMPEVKDIAIKISGLSSYGFIKGFRPCDISISLMLAHVVTVHKFVEATVCSTGHRTIASAKYASIKEPVLIEKLTAGGPRKATCRGAFPDVERMTDACRRGYAA